MNITSPIVIAVSLFLVGCLTQIDLSMISPQMSKEQVIAALGKPKNVAVQGRTEYFTYESEASYFDGRIGGEFLYVRFIDGKVESYGRKGDFDSTKNPAIDVNTRSTVDTKITQAGGGSIDLEVELRRLDRLRKDGLISDADFESQKKKLLERAIDQPK